MQGKFTQHPERADGDTTRVKHVTVLICIGFDDIATRCYQLQANHLRRDRTECHPRPVRAGGNSTCDRLLVDVPLIGQRQTDLQQRCTEIGNLCARLDPHTAGCRIRVDDAFMPVDVDQAAIGNDDGREGMAGARHADGRCAVMGSMGNGVGNRRLVFRHDHT